MSYGPGYDICKGSAALRVTVALLAAAQVLGVMPLTQIPKLGCEVDKIHAAFSVSESNFGEVGGGQRKRAVEQRSLRVAAPIFGHMQYKVVSASTEDGAASENLEAQGGRLFVGLEPWIDGALEFAQEIETKEHSQESGLGGEKRP